MRYYSGSEVLFLFHSGLPRTKDTPTGHPGHFEMWQAGAYQTKQAKLCSVPCC